MKSKSIKTTEWVLKIHKYGYGIIKSDNSNEEDEEQVQIVCSSLYKIKHNEGGTQVAISRKILSKTTELNVAPRELNPERHYRSEEVTGKKVLLH